MLNDNIIIIYWIGKDIDDNNNNKNKINNIQNCDYKEFDNVDTALKEVKTLQFKFVYFIINYELFESFTQIYNNTYIKEISAIIASIIITDNIYENINKKYVNDPFYNPGGITDNIEGVINYIEYKQNSYYSSPNSNVKLSELHDGKYGEIQACIVSEAKDFIVPIIWNKIVNLKVNGSALAKLQNILNSNHNDRKECKDFIYPTREKIMKISEHIFAKFFLYLYTLESSFYKIMNRLLSHEDGFDIYREYITIMFQSLKNKTFETYTKKTLYRGSKISRNDFEILCNLMEIKKENEDVIFFSGSFLSFSLDESVALSFISGPNNNNMINCEFIIDKAESPFAYNIDVKDNSKFQDDEREVLFLPLSCFIVKKVEKGDKYCVIYLKYLDEYNKKIEEKFQRIHTNEKDKLDIQTAFLTDFGKNIYFLFNNIINDYNKYIKTAYSIDINADIPDIHKKYTPENKHVSIKFDTNEKKNIIVQKSQITTNKIIYNVTEKDIDKEGFVKILGENIKGDDFVKLNKNKVDLEINGIPTELCYKYKLKKGINEISFYFKENVDNLSYLFFEVTALSDISALGNWNISKVTNLSFMFSGCEQLSDISSLFNWDTSSCTNFSSLFSNCTSLKDILPLNRWNVSNGTHFSYLFYNCNSLSNLNGIKNWDVRNGKFFTCSFAYCSKLKNISALENWNTINGIFFSHLFFNCSSLSDITPLENWDVSKGTFFDYIFCNCSSLYDISPLANWKVDSGKNFSYAFCGCILLIDISPLKNWNISSDSNLICMFKSSKIIEETKPFWYYRTLEIIGNNPNI